jgi:hypothetical protein
LYGSAKDFGNRLAKELLVERLLIFLELINYSSPFLFQRT